MIGFVNRVLDVEADVDLDRFTMAQVESNAVRCPDPDAAERMYNGALFTARTDFAMQVWATLLEGWPWVYLTMPWHRTRGLPGR